MGKSSTAVDVALNVFADLSSMRAEAQKLSYDHLAQHLATFEYVDTTPPNLRVILTDYKTRTSVYFAVAMVQSVEKDSTDDNNIKFEPPS